jgi:hypothetical protein
MENQDVANANISLEQILAAIINKFGSIDIDIKDLLTNYSAKSISVTQDPDNKVVTFELVESPTETE